MTDLGLRERKKARTRQLIADAAARLFAERGYEQVAVSDVARAPEVAKLRGIALAGVFQIIIAEAGRRTREGQNQDQIAGQLRPAIEAVLDDLDRWLTPATK